MSELEPKKNLNAEIRRLEEKEAAKTKQILAKGLATEKIRARLNEPYSLVRLIRAAKEKQRKRR